MAQWLAIANGNWSASGTWNQVTNTPTLHASTNITLNSTTGIFTATFTAPNTTNACVGVLFHITTTPVNANYVVTLQESGVDTAATMTIPASSFPATGNWIFFKFPTPYVFTTAAAGAYRFKITRASATTNALVAADSGGSNPTFLAIYNRIGVPATTDDTWILSGNASGTMSVVMDGTQTVGGGGNTTGLSRRSITNAVTISQGGLLIWDTSANATLTSKGNITISNGELRIGTVATSYPTGTVATLNFNENGTSGNYGLETYDNGKLTLQGTPKSSTSLWKTTYTGGSGTAGSPMLVSDSVNWDVGDEIIVCANSNTATNYNESENKFIKTKNSPTSFVLSNTSGGAEAGLSFVHASGTYTLNVQRNIIIQSTTTTEGWYFANSNTIAGDVDVDWVRAETVGGSSTTGKEGFSIVFAASSTAACDYTVVYRELRRGFACLNSIIALTFTGIIACNAVSATSAGAIDVSTNAHNKIFVDCFAIKNERAGFQVGTVANVTFTRCVAISNNTDGITSICGGFAIAGNSFTFNSCEAHCNRIQGIAFRTSSAVTFTSLLCGTKGTNVIDILAESTFFVQAVFINSTFGSATLVSQYTGLLQGSELRFHTLNLTANNHVWYTPQGIARSSGAGLVDTTNKTSGNLTARIAPEDLTLGFVWEFLIGVKANTAAQIVGFAQKNVAFGTGTCTVEMFLPGSTTADATATLDNTTGAWQVFNLAASYVGSVSGFATIRITAKTATASAYVYFADFYNGTNVLTGLQSWYNGKPSPVMTELLGDAAAVWAILTSTLTTAGTVGKLVADNLNATIDSRASQTSVDVIDDLLDTEFPALTASVAALPTANQNADALLKRDWTAVTGEASRSVLNALRKLRNKVSFGAGTLSVKKEDDSTDAYTQSVTQDASQTPFKEIG